MNYSSNFEKLIRKQQNKLAKYIEKNDLFLRCELSDEKIAVGINTTVIIIPKQFMQMDEEKLNSTPDSKFLKDIIENDFRYVEVTDIQEIEEFVELINERKNIVVRLRKAIIRDFQRKGVCFEIKSEIDAVRVFFEGELIALVMPVGRKKERKKESELMKWHKKKILKTKSKDF